MQSGTVTMIEEVAFSIGTLREAKKRFSDRLAPEFSIFDYFRADEMALSSCIAGLLDPGGKHGQGSTFLQAFVEKICISPKWIQSHEYCEVFTEKQANGQRRIDVYLAFKDGLIGIENKPWAGDQERQLIDYAEYLKVSAKSENWLLLYLCNDEPSDESIPKSDRQRLEESGNFLSFNYQQLIDWLEICRAKTKSLNVQIFIEELIKFVRVNVNGELEMSEENEVCATILSSKEKLGSAFQIFKAIDGAKRELLSRFKDDLKSEFDSAGFHLVWDKDLITNWRSGVGFGVKFDERQNVYLRFDFESSGLNGLEWGLKRETESVAIGLEFANEIRVVMNAFDFGSGRSSNWWPWYTADLKKGLNADIRNWNKDDLPWSMIMDKGDGGLVKLIVKLAHRVNDAFAGKHASLLPGNSTVSPLI